MKEGSPAMAETLSEKSPAELISVRQVRVWAPARTVYPSSVAVTAVTGLLRKYRTPFWAEASARWMDYRKGLHTAVFLESMAQEAVSPGSMARMASPSMSSRPLTPFFSP